jgi:putative hemolysin
MLKNRTTAIRKYFLKKAILQYKLSPKKRAKQRLTLFTNTNGVGIGLNVVAFLLRRTLKIHQMKAAFARYTLNFESGQQYFRKLTDAFNIDLNSKGQSLSHVSKTGPVIFYANHPFSGMDAFALAAQIEKFRPDIKVLAASYLQHFPGFKDRSFIINVHDKEKNKDQNRAVYEKVNEHIREGKSLLIFPAGDVSELTRKNKVYALDPPWQDGLIRFGEQSGRTEFVPVFIQGEPSRKYLMLRLKAKILSNFYVLHEFANQINTQMCFYVGNGISLNDIAHLRLTEKVSYLRAKLYELGTNYYKSINGNHLIAEHCPSFPLLKQMESSLMQAVDAALIFPKLSPLYLKR